MSSLNRSLTGPVLTFDLDQHLNEMRGEEGYRRTGRAGRTLTKSGRFRLVLIAMASGNEIGTHQADSPMTLHVLTGGLAFRAAGDDYRMAEGNVLFFGPGDAHDIRATEDTALLLTISVIGDDFGGEQSAQR